MKNFLSHLFIMIMFVCTTFTGVSGQELLIVQNLNSTLTAGWNNSSYLGSVEVVNNGPLMSLASVTMQFTGVWGNQNANDLMNACWMSAEFYVKDTNGLSRGYQSLSGPLNSPPAYTVSFFANWESIYIQDIWITCPCFAPSYNDMGLNNEMILSEVRAQATSLNNAYYEEDFHRYLSFVHPIDSMTFHATGTAHYYQGGLVSIPYEFWQGGNNYDDLGAYFVSPTGQQHWVSSVSQLAQGWGGTLFYNLNSIPLEDGTWTFSHYLQARATCLTSTLTGSFEMSGVLGTDDIGSVTPLTMFPSPTTQGGLVTIAVDENEALKQVEVFDLSGKQVVIGGDVNPLMSNTYQLETTNLSAGTYMVRILTKGGAIATRKLVVQ